MERKRFTDAISIGIGSLFVLTFIAQYGGRHSAIHYELSQVAMGAEIGTAIAINMAESLKSRLPQLAHTMRFLAAIGIIVMAGSFVNFLRMDPEYIDYFNNGKSVTNPSHMAGFAEILNKDFWRHLDESRERLKRDLSLSQR